MHESLHDRQRLRRGILSLLAIRDSDIRLLGVIRWIMEGNRGLVYVRVMRTPSPGLYGPDDTFAYGTGQTLREGAGDAAVLVTSGRGVHEALGAAALLSWRPRSPEPRRMSCTDV